MCKVADAAARDNRPARGILKPETAAMMHDSPLAKVDPNSLLFKLLFDEHGADVARRAATCRRC